MVKKQPNERGNPKKERKEGREKEGGLRESGKQRKCKRTHQEHQRKKDRPTDRLVTGDLLEQPKQAIASPIATRNRHSLVWICLDQVMKYHTIQCETQAVEEEALR